MFDSNVSRDEGSKKMTRRVFLAGGVTAAAGIAVLSHQRSSTVEASGAVHGTPGMVTIVNFSDDGKNLGKQTVAKVVKTDAEWRRQLGRTRSGSRGRRTRRCLLPG